MNKIYLIEDNLDGNRAKYGAGKIDEGYYNDILEIKDKLSKDSDLSFLEDAACVLLHRSYEDFIDGSYHDDSHFVANYIQKMIPALGTTVPFVIFSDGDQSEHGEMREDHPNMIYSLGKKAFYDRLVDFLDNYKKVQVIDLKILAYGANYQTKIVEDGITEVLNLLRDLAPDETVPPLKVNTKALKSVVEKSLPAIGVTYDELIIGLKFNPLKVSEFKNRLNTILNDFIEYGKNYFTWK